MKPLRTVIRRPLGRRGLMLSAAAFACAGALVAPAQTSPDNVALQIARLGSPNPELRRYAADALAKFADPRSLQPLIAALGDSDTQTRAYAAAGLGKLHNPQAVEPLIPLLNDPEEVVTESAAISLGQLKDPRAIAPLVAALANVHLASTALLQFGPAAVDPLLAAAKNSDPGVRSRALETLALTRDPRALPVLTSALNDDEAQVREVALFGLNALNPPGFAQILASALKNPATQVAALRYAGAAQDPEIKADIIAALQDSDPSVCGVAVSYLKPALAGDPQVAPLLVALAQDRDASVSWSALNTLAVSRVPQAIDAMVSFAEGANPKVDRYLALQQLGKVHDPRAAALLIELLSGTDTQAAMIAAEQLGDSRDAQAVPALAAAAASKVPSVALDAITSLGKIGAPAVDSLLALLKQPELQYYVIEALANTKVPRAVPPLIALLQTPYTGKPQPYGVITQGPGDPGPVRPMTYQALIGALGQLGDPRAVAPLIQYMQNGPVARNAVPDQLAALGASSIGPLIPLLHSSDENTRRLAAETLAGLAIAQTKDPRPHDALVAAAASHDIAIVAGAYEFYVGLGAPGTENDLVAALERFPNQGMAEYFLNCGDVALEDAAIAWGQKIHYHITQQVYGVVWGRRPQPPETLANPFN